MFITHQRRGQQTFVQISRLSPCYDGIRLKVLNIFHFILRFRLHGWKMKTFWFGYLPNPFALWFYSELASFEVCFLYALSSIDSRKPFTHLTQFFIPRESFFIPLMVFALQRVHEKAGLWSGSLLMGRIQQRERVTNAQKWVFNLLWLIPK